MTPSKTPVTADDVHAFTSICVSLRSLWCHLQDLFERSDLRRELLHQIAPTFFGDLNLIMLQALYLQVCTITDPEETMGKKNLTVQFLVNHADLSAAPSELDKLKACASRMDTFRKKVVIARNQLIGHLDRKAVLAGVPLGAASVDDWNRFWLDLQDFLFILQRRFVDPTGDFHLNAVGGLSDADLLVKALRESTYFNDIMRDNAMWAKVADVPFASKYHDA